MLTPRVKRGLNKYEFVRGLIFCCSCSALHVARGSYKNLNF